MSDGYADELDLESQYRDMDSDATRERETEEWMEGLIADMSTEE
jgi:hypothetical protein